MTNVTLGRSNSRHAPGSQAYQVVSSQTWHVRLAQTSLVVGRTPMLAR